MKDWLGILKEFTRDGSTIFPQPSQCTNQQHHGMIFKVHKLLLFGYYVCIYYYVDICFFFFFVSFFSCLFFIFIFYFIFFFWGDCHKSKTFLIFSFSSDVILWHIARTLIKKKKKKKFFLLFIIILLLFLLLRLLLPVEWWISDYQSRSFDY